MAFREQKISKVLEPEITPMQLLAPKQWLVSSDDSDRKVKLLLFGDSRIAEWRVDWPRSYDVINQGISGSTSSESVQRFQLDVLSLQPEWVVLQVGVNDLVASRLVLSEERESIENLIIENTLTLIKQCLDHNIHIIYFSILPSIKPDALRKLVWQGDLSESATRVNKKIFRSIERLRRHSTMVSGTNQLFLIDTQQVFNEFQSERDQSVIPLNQSTKKVVSDAWQRDALHWTAAAYLKLQEEVLDTIERAK